MCPHSPLDQSGCQAGPLKWLVSPWLLRGDLLAITGPRRAGGDSAAAQRRGPVPAAISLAQPGSPSSPLRAPAGPAPMSAAAASPCWSRSELRLRNDPALIGRPPPARAHWPAQRPRSLARTVRGRYLLALRLGFRPLSCFPGSGLGRDLKSSLLCESLTVGGTQHSSVLDIS